MARVETKATLQTSDPRAVRRSVAMLHVHDVQRSMDFYRHLGLEVTGQHSQQGRPFWAHLGQAPGELFLAQASGPVDHGVQAVLIYLYAADVAGLRQHLLDVGLVEGEFTGPDQSPKPLPPVATGRVYPLRRPFYMPAGELRVEDPDGYVLLIGQLE